MTGGPVAEVSFTLPRLWRAPAMAAGGILSFLVLGGNAEAAGIATAAASGLFLVSLVARAPRSTPAARCS